jgi:hypothetical protein
MDGEGPIPGQADIELDAVRAQAGGAQESLDGVLENAGARSGLPR